MRLDCLPLALELAAARTRTLGPTALLHRLERRLPLLTGRRRDSPERQRTLRATIEWSYDLLGDDAKTLFARLSLFAGSFSLEAVEEVCEAGLDTLDALVDLSLVKPSGETRFMMLETIREYAGDLLRADGLEQLGDRRRRHALHYLALAERAEPELRGPDQRGCLERLELDHDNLRAALSWTREAADAEVGLRLAAALWRFWRTHNHLAEGTRMLEALLRLGEAAPALPRARALLGASRLALDQGDLTGSVAFAEEALAVAQRTGAAREVAAATENLGVTTFVAGAESRALALLEDSIARFRALGDSVGTADALNNLGSALLEIGDGARAARVLEEALALQRDAENARGIEFVVHTLGYVALHEGDLELARLRLEESLVLAQELGHLAGIGWSLEGLAHVAARRGNDRRALALWAAGESIRTEADAYMQPTEAAIHDDGVSLVRARLGEDAVAAAWFRGAALASKDAVAYALTTLD
jgi:tetratricopeptide (TPR) repeat protein